MEDPAITLMLDRMLYYTFLHRGLYQTAEVFRLETGSDFSPSSPISPLSSIEDDDDVSGDNSHTWWLITNEVGQMEWVALPNNDGSSYNDEDNMRQQTGLSPSREHELNKQMVEELTLDEIFGGTDDKGLASVGEACQSSQIVTNECCVKVEEDDTLDFFITNDLIELSSLVNIKKNEKGYSCSREAYLYDSSSFDLGNKDDGGRSAFTFDESHEALNNDEIQGLTDGGNLILQTMSHSKRLKLCSTPANTEDTDTLEPPSVAQATPRTTEIISNEHGDGGMLQGGNNSDSETGFLVPLLLKNFPTYSNFCPQNKADQKGCSRSQDAYMHDSSLNDVITGDNLVPELPTSKENLITCLPPSTFDATGTEEQDSVAQTIRRSVEFSTNESGRKRKSFEVYVDGEGDSSMRNAHVDGYSCGKGNEDDAVSLQNESHQNNAYPDK